MALRKCHECGKEISTTAANCPSCGAKPRMAKWKKILIGMAVSFCLLPVVVYQVEENRRSSIAAQRLDAARSRAEQKVKEFEVEGAVVIQQARAALESGDFEAAKKIIDPWSPVRSTELVALRDEIAAKKKVQDEAFEKVDLLKRASALESTDGAEGEGIYMRLVEIEPGNELFKKKLSAFSKVHQKQAEEAMQMAALSRRQRYARSLENQMLSKGMSADVVTQGKQSTTLHIKYVLVSKAFVYQFNHNTDLMAEIRSSGFTKVVLTDGFNETWTLDLTEKAQ